MGKEELKLPKIRSYPASKVNAPPEFRGDILADGIGMPRKNIRYVLPNLLDLFSDGLSPEELGELTREREEEMEIERKFRLAVEQAAELLSEQEKFVLDKRYPPSGVKVSWTQARIAGAVGRSPSTIARIEKSAVAKVRKLHAESQDQ